MPLKRTTRERVPQLQKKSGFSHPTSKAVLHFFIKGALSLLLLHQLQQEGVWGGADFPPQLAPPPVLSGDSPVLPAAPAGFPPALVQEGLNARGSRQDAWGTLWEAPGCAAAASLRGTTKIEVCPQGLPATKCPGPHGGRQRTPPGRLVMGSGPRGGSPSHWPVLYAANPGRTARSWFLCTLPSLLGPTSSAHTRGRGQFCPDLGGALSGVLLGPLGFSGPHSPPAAGLPLPPMSQSGPLETSGCL